MKYPVSHCCAIILAAGQSSRLGTPKQLLEYRGKTLLQLTIDAARSANIKSIVLVLGSNVEFILNQTKTDGLHIVKNRNWQSGMASSIIEGISSLQIIESDADAVILMVCDQPYISNAVLSDLLAKQHETDKPIVASKYDDTIGVPALFHKTLFTQLLELKGDAGARKIIQQYPEMVATVDFPLGAVDIDTPEMYKKLK